MRSLLFEIGTEELPASSVRPALEQLANTVLSGLDAARLSRGAHRVWGTPRRLALLVEEVADQSADVEEEKTGPPARVAFDAEGNPTKAALSFAARSGVEVSEFGRKTTDKGEYLVARVLNKGEPALDLLGPILHGALRLDFAKSMRWGDVDVAFARPVQWICALHGDEVVDLAFGDVRSGRTSRGHRFLGSGPISIRHADEYLERLEAAHVVIDPERRASAIRSALEECAREHGGSVREDPQLLEEVTFLVEKPFPIVGSFDEEFLSLPSELLIQETRHHQRYFVLLGEAGRLMPTFIAISNTEVADPALSRSGYERVLRARLADARFFFDEDRKRALRDRVPELENVVFHHQVGSLRAKVQRVETLVGELAERAGMGEWAEEATRAAHLAKADLVTLAVGEFPELQGVMGSEYALLDGESEGVARAIREHYLPQGRSDELPSAAAGALLGIADRLDTLCALFAVGESPRGNADPSGLRRACIAVVRVACGFGISFSLRELILRCEELLDPTLPPELNARARSRRGKGDEPLVEQIEAFFRARMKALWGEAHRSDVVEAVLLAGHDDIPDTARRIEALSELVRERDLSPVATVFKRAGNIVSKQLADLPEGGVSPDDLAEPAEKALYEAIGAAEAKVQEKLAQGDYLSAFGAIADLEAPVARLFDEVMVMSDDPRERANRGRLLREVARLLGPLADLSSLEVDRGRADGEAD